MTYLERVKNLNCVICLHKLGVKTTPVEAHHVGTGLDRHDYATVALCDQHHRNGVNAIHVMHRRGFYDFWKVTDILMLAWTNEQMWRGE